MIQIYHNPRCGKSRECLAMLAQSGKVFETVLYLATPPDAAAIKALIRSLKINPIDLIRQNEPIWIEKYKDRQLTNAQRIRAMVKHPILIERPIVVQGEKAVIARPAEKALTLI